MTEATTPRSEVIGSLLRPQRREGFRQRGSDPDQLLDITIELDNTVNDGHPGVTCGLHICRGNNQASSTPVAGMRPSRPRSLARPAFSVSCWNMTMSGLAPLSHCARCPRTAPRR